MIIQIERVYETDKTSSATRFLVDRLWPRGIKSGGIEMTAWLKDVAPSNELRKWFNHDPVKWKTFQSRYFAELDEKPDSLAPLFEACKKVRLFCCVVCETKSTIKPWHLRSIWKPIMAKRQGGSLTSLTSGPLEDLATHL